MSKLTTLFYTLKYSFLLKKKLQDLRFYGPATIISPKQFESGKGLRVNHGCYIHAKGGVISGNNLTMSAGSKIISSGINIEKFKLETRNADYHINSKVILGDNVWLGAGSIILPGVSLLGRNIIVAANSVVTKSFNQSNIILAGSPAKILKEL